jgi:hypothetical protein
MNLVDTSVWIHALRPEGDPSIRSRLKPLIVGGETAVTEWIILELMTGLLAPERKETLLHWFDPITRLHFEPSWWEDAWDCAARLRKRGVSPTAADCFIATVAIKHQVTLVHCDTDFETMKPTIPLKTLDWRPHLSRR